VKGAHDVGVGVVVGSNVFNLAALLGIPALLAGRVRIHKHGLVLSGGVAVVVAIIGLLVAVDTVPGGIGLVLAALVLARLGLVWLIVGLARVVERWRSLPVVVAAARARPLRTAIAGCLLTAGMLAAAVLAALTVVGLVVAAALTGALLLAAVLGVSFALAAVPEPGRQRWIIAALAVPLVGDALLGMASVVAVGGLFHHLLDGRASASPAPLTPRQT
jgi:Ca2+/Na+ antiporter